MQQFAVGRLPVCHSKQPVSNCGLLPSPITILFTKRSVAKAGLKFSSPVLLFCQYVTFSCRTMAITPSKIFTWTLSNPIPCGLAQRKPRKSLQWFCYGITLMLADLAHWQTKAGKLTQNLPQSAWVMRLVCTLLRARGSS